MPLYLPQQQQQQHGDQQSISQLLREVGGDALNAGSGALYSILSVLSRPYHAITGGVYGGLREGSLSGIGSGFISGLMGTGKDKYAGDILGELGMQRGDKLGTLPLFGDVHTRDLLAGAINVGADPITYAKIGSLTNAGAKAYAKNALAETVPQQFAKGQRAMLQFGNPFKDGGAVAWKGVGAGSGIADAAAWGRDLPWVQKMFGVRKTTAMKQLLSQKEGLEQYVTKEWAPYVTQIERSLDDIAKQTGKPREEINEAFVRLAQVPDEAKLADKEAYTSFLKSFKQATSDQLKINGVDDTVMEGVLKAVKDYTDEAKKLIDDGLSVKEAVWSAIGKAGNDNYSREALRLAKEHWDEVFANNVPASLRSQIELASANPLQIAKDFHSQMLHAEKAAGIPVDNLSSFSQYFARAATDEAVQGLRARAAGKPVAMEATSMLQAHINREGKMRNLTLGEANKVLKEMLGLKGDAFFMDPIIAMNVRAKSSAKAISQADFVTNFVEQFGRVGMPFRNVMEGQSHLGKYWARSGNPTAASMWEQLQSSGHIKQLVDAGKLDKKFLNTKWADIVIPERAAQMMDETLHLYDDAWGAYREAFGWFHRAWKPWTLLVAPAYYSRNVVDDSFRAMMGGLMPGNKAYQESYRMVSAAIRDSGAKGVVPKVFQPFIRAMEKVGDNLPFQPFKSLGDKDAFWKAASGVDNLTNKQLYDEAVKAGVISSGHLNFELQAHAKELVRRYGYDMQKAGTLKRHGKNALVALQDPVNNPTTLGKMFRTAKNVNTTREDWSRMAMYIYKRKKGFNSAAAAGEVDKYLYSFRGLGKGEEVLRSLMPFYAFTRANVPFWLTQTMQQPGLISNLIGKPTQIAVDADELVPEFVKEGVPIYLGKTDDGKSQYLYGTGLSAEDLNKIVINRHDIYGSGLRSLEKFFLSSTSPLIKGPLQAATRRDFFFGSSMDDYAKAYQVLSNLPKPAQDFIGLKAWTDKDGKTRYRINPDALNFLRSTPWGRLYSMVGKGFDDDRSMLQKFGDTMVGWKTTVVDPEREQRRAFYKLKEEVLGDQEQMGNVRFLNIPYIPKGQEQNVDPRLVEAIKQFNRRGK